MSTNFRPARTIPMEDLFDGRLGADGVCEAVVEGSTSSTTRCMTDGRTRLWVYGDRNVECMTRYAGGGSPGKILGKIAETFETDIYSEYDPRFWGFDTQAEWDAWQERAAKESRAKFCAEIIKFVLGQPNDIDEGTVGMLQAEIARELVAVSPDLVLPDRTEDLMASVERTYNERRAMSVTLADEDIALATLALTHENAVPSA